MGLPWLKAQGEPLMVALCSKEKAVCYSISRLRTLAVHMHLCVHVCVCTFICVHTFMGLKAVFELQAVLSHMARVPGSHLGPLQEQYVLLTTELSLSRSNGLKF